MALTVGSTIISILILAVAILELCAKVHSAPETPPVKPKIQHKPKDVTVIQGEQASFYCNATGVPEPAVSWRFSGSILKQIGNKLVIKNVRNTAEYEGKYTCIASSRAGKAEESATLTVLVPPTIKANLSQGIILYLGQTLRLKCDVYGDPEVKFEWYKIEDNAEKASKLDEKKSELVIRDVRVKDEAKYGCDAANELGIEMVDPVLVRVNTSLRIINGGENFTAVPWNRVTVRCVASSEIAPQVKILRNGRELQAKTNVSQDNKVVVAEFLIILVKTDDSGVYTCEATNRQKAVRAEVRLLVDVPIKIDMDVTLEDQTFTEELENKSSEKYRYLSATFVRELTKIFMNEPGFVRVEVLGFRNGSVVVRFRVIYEVRVTKPEDKPSLDSILRIADVVKRKVKESHGVIGVLKIKPESIKALIPPTKIADLSRGIILYLGQTLRLKCDVYGDPVPSFTWYKRATLDVETDILRGQRKSELIIQDVRFKDTGEYSCEGVNRFGRLYVMPAWVQVITSLDIINGGENFTAIVGNNVTVRCVASSEITPQVKILRNGRELQAKAGASKDNKVVAAEFVIGSVRTDDSGVYTCEATNRQKAVRAEVQLLVHVPIKIDMDVTLENQTYTEELENKSSEKYRNLSATFVQELTKIYMNEPGFVRIEVLQFRNGSVAVRFRIIYEVRVAKPEDKPPPDTNVRIADVFLRKVKETRGVIGKLKIKTEAVKALVRPPSPRNLTATNIKKRQMSIEWKHPLFHDNYDVTHYVIKYKVFGSDWQKKELHSKHANFYSLEELEADTKYSIQTHAVNRLGEGLPSNVVETETLSDNGIRAFWETFAKVFIPLLIISIIIFIIVVIYLRRRRQRNMKLTEAMDGQRDEEQQNEQEDISENMELASRWKEIPRDNIVLDNQLGSGQFGVVYKGSLKEDGRDEAVPCAVKMLKANPSQEAIRDLFNELEIMASVDEHPNIVNLLGACTGRDGPMYVIVEFAENGGLLDYLRAHRMSARAENGNLEKVSSLRNQEKIKLGFDVASGMQHLTKFRCVHRDLAARNILLGKDRKAKVADFGLARDVYEKGFYEKSSTGGKLPAKWMSIEALETLKATSESDVWSFGVLLWEIETGGKMPFDGLSFKQILACLKTGTRLLQPANCSSEVYSIMRTCWEADPRKRPSFGELVWKLHNLYIHYLED